MSRRDIILSLVSLPTTTRFWPWNRMWAECWPSWPASPRLSARNC